MGSQDYYLQQNDADSQVWMLTRKSGGAEQRSRETIPQPKHPLDRSRRREGNLPTATVSKDAEEMLGLLCVYVDDFLAIAPQGPVRDALVRALTSLWEFGPERILSVETSLTFLGIDWFKRANGDIFLTQERFTKELLERTT